MTVEDVVSEIKKEIIESHNLIIKTDNLVKNLASEIKAVQKKQERYERKYIFNSVVAYVIFVVVIFGGLYVAFDAKVGVVRHEKEALEEKLTKAKAEMDELQNKLSVKARQEKVTERFLRLKKENRPFDALKVAENLDPNMLSPVLAHMVETETRDLRRTLATEALDAGKTLYQKAHLNKALRELDRAMQIKPPAELASKIERQRAQVLLKLNRNAQAAEAFLAASQADPTSKSADYLLYMAAGTLETSGDVPRALQAYERILKEHPESPYASQARRRIATLTRKGKLETPPPKPKATGETAPKASRGTGERDKQHAKPAPENSAPAPDKPGE
jgi:tetratricopeptide (TPR) repeat protein